MNRGSHKARIALAIAGFLFSGCANEAGEAVGKAPPVAHVRAGLPEPGPFEAERSRHTATLLAEGTVLIAGGRDTETGKASAVAERYVSAPVGFRRLPELGTARYGHTATRLFDGTVLIAGGFDGNDVALSTAELFLPDSEKFETLDHELTASRGEHTATLLSDGRVLLVGGASRADLETPRTTAEIYDPVDHAFHRTTGAPRAPGGRNVAVSLLDGRVLVAWTASGTEEIFDLASGRFSAATGAFDLSGDFGTVLGAVRLGDGSLAVSGTSKLAGVGGAFECAPGETICDGHCSDLQNGSSWGECGSCDVRCGPEQTCVNGVRVCAPPLTPCGAACADLSYDSGNCGACGQACSGDAICAGGQCICQNTLCGSECANLAANAQHCGACFQACESDSTCGGGQCMRCKLPSVRCGNQCSDTARDPGNCGACGHECDAGFGCREGQCVPGGCAYEQQECDGVCRNTNEDPANCGACQRVCSGDAMCQAGVCALPSASEPTVGATSTLTRSSGSVWSTSRSLAKTFNEEDASVWRTGIPSRNLTDERAYGGPGHTATGLPDGSVFIVGGAGTPSSRRLQGQWRSADVPGASGEQFFGSFQTGLLPNGRLVILGLSQIFEFDGGAVSEVGEVGADIQDMGLAPLSVVTQPNGTVLLVFGSRESHTAVLRLYDPQSGSLRRLDLELNVGWKALPLFGGAVLIGDKTGFSLVHPAAAPGEFEVSSLPADFDCFPELARLPNGRVLVVENETVHELDPRRLVLSEVASLAIPRCNAAVLVQPSGSVLIAGGSDPSNSRSSPAGELYDGSQTTRTVDIDAGLIGFGSLMIHWFDEVFVFPTGLSGAVARLDWQYPALESMDAGQIQIPVSPLPDGSFLHIQQWDPRLKRFWVGRPRPQVPFAYPEQKSLRMNDVVDFEREFPGHPFPGTAAEGSSGTTTSSPTNLPVAVWFPAQGGWPSMGTITKADGVTSYRAPRTPFPGLGFLFLATNGELEGIGPLTIEPSPDGNGCTDAGECSSGFCVDGVCCESACDGSCEACSRTKKGTGEDGVCSFVEEGTPDDACDVEPVSTCGHDGTCNARGRCAKYPDGAECGPGDVCASGACRSIPITPPPGDGGAGGEPAMPEDACNGESTLVKADESEEECSPYRCPVGEDRCPNSCKSNRDCVGGFVCASGRCAHSLDVTKIEGCGCRVVGVPRFSDFTAVGHLAVLAFLGRLRRRSKPSRKNTVSLRKGHSSSCRSRV